MGGSSIDDDWEFISPSNELRTLVLVGRTGNGKSATGNSILQRKAFKSRSSSAGVTSTCELQRTVSKDGQILNVIDTPGLFDFSAESEFIGKEIVKCINMAKDGIHAALLVLSVRNRFTKEEEAAVHSLQNFFGSKINDYMIAVFTGGDELEENDETLEEYLGCDCPESLKEILLLCGNRQVLFDNRTKDENKKAGQVHQLLSLVNTVLVNNSGKPYTDELFVELKKGAMKRHHQIENFSSLQGYPEHKISELTEQMYKSNEEQLKRITEMELIEEEPEVSARVSEGVGDQEVDSGYVAPHDDEDLEQVPQEAILASLGAANDQVVMGQTSAEQAARRIRERDVAEQTAERVGERIEQISEQEVSRQTEQEVLRQMSGPAIERVSIEQEGGDAPSVRGESVTETHVVESSTVRDSLDHSFDSEDVFVPQQLLGPSQPRRVVEPKAPGKDYRWVLGVACDVPLNTDEELTAFFEPIFESHPILIGAQVLPPDLMLLAKICRCYPETFAKFSMKSSMMKTSVMEVLLSVVKNFSTHTLQSIGAVASEFKKIFDDLEEFNLQIPWLRARLTVALKAVDSSLLQDMAKLELEQRNLRKGLGSVEKEELAIREQMKVLSGRLEKLHQERSVISSKQVEARERQAKVIEDIESYFGTRELGYLLGCLGENLLPE